MTDRAIRTVEGRSESEQLSTSLSEGSGGPTILISIADGTITISDGESTDQNANHLRLDTENAGKLGRVLVALVTALDPDTIQDGNGRPPAADRADETLPGTVAARAGRAPELSGWSSEQLAMIENLVSLGVDREDIKALTPERFVQFCEAWLQMDDRLNETQCVACGKTFAYERKGRPPLTCSAECRRKRKTRPTK